MAKKRNRKMWVAMAVLLVGMAPAIASGGTIYVDVTTPDNNDGSSWAKAYKYLQDGLAVAGDGNDIWVAEGTYRPDEDDANHPAGSGLRTDTFQLIDGVAIYGGFAGGETTLGERDWRANETILSGDINIPADNTDNSYHVVTGSGTNNTAILDGFTITAGNANGSAPDNRGGGMYNSSGSPTLTNCTFSRNSTGYRGGGMQNYWYSNPTLTNCTFSGNTAVNAGGGMSNWESSSPTLTNCTFSGNSGFAAGGMGNYKICTPTLTNCTFSGNTSSYEGGMRNGNVSSPTLTNCILWGNSGAQIGNYGGSSVTVSYSDVQGGWGGTGNINSDPLFVDADGPDDTVGTEDDNLRLSADSNCIDAGDNTAVPADTADLDGDANTTEPIPFDLDGHQRFVDEPDTIDTGNGTAPIVDMGAYERGVCGNVDHPYPVGDFSGPGGVPDCYVDFFDFAVFAAHWLEYTGPE